VSFLPSPPANPGDNPVRSHICRPVALSGRTTTGNIYTNSRTNSLFVATCIDLINYTGGSTDVCTLGVSSSGAYFWSGVVGTGSYDRFPWRGELAVFGSESISVQVISGGWGIVICGYYTPQILAAGA